MSTQQNTLIEQLVTDARQAQKTINNYSQEKIDELILAVAWEIIQPENNQELSEMAVSQTGLGNCLLYTSPSPRDQRGSRMPSSA